MARSPSAVIHVFVCPAGPLPLRMSSRSDTGIPFDSIQLLVWSSRELQTSLGKAWFLSHELNKPVEWEIKTLQLGAVAQLQSMPSPWCWAFIMQLALSTLLFKAELKVELNSWRSQPCGVMRNYREGDGAGTRIQLVLGGLSSFICTELCETVRKILN